MAISMSKNERCMIDKYPCNSDECDNCEVYKKFKREVVKNEKGKKSK